MRNSSQTHDAKAPDKGRDGTQRVQLVRGYNGLALPEDTAKVYAHGRVPVKLRAAFANRLPGSQFRADVARRWTGKTVVTVLFQGVRCPPRHSAKGKDG